MIENNTSSQIPAPIPQFTHSQLKLRFIPIFALITVVIAISVGVYFWKQSETKQLKDKQLQTSKILSPTPSRVSLVTGYVLTLPNGSAVEINDNTSKFVTWHEWLFAGVGYYSDQFVYAFNMQTGEVKKLFENNNVKQGISDITIVDNKLLVSVGGYLAGGGLYRLNLPPDSQAAKLVTDSSNGEVVKIDGQYWLRDGEGDACWGYTTYSLLNTNTYKTTEIATDGEDCDGSGTRILSLNYQQSAIVAEKVGDTTVSNSEEQNNRVTYTSIYQVRYDSPKQKINLISIKTMPKGITSAEYDSSIKKIILKSTSDTFFFDPTTKELTRVNNYVPESTPTVTPTIEVVKLEFKDILPFLQKIPSVKIETKYQ